MKQNTFLSRIVSISFLFLGILILASCKRGIDINAIEAMPEGTDKTAAMLYYYQGLRKGDTITVEKSSKPKENSAMDLNAPIYLTTSPEIKRDVNLKVLNAVCQVFRGDTLVVLGEFERNVWGGGFMKKANSSESIKVTHIKNGKPNKDGWFYAGLATPLDPNWAYVFYDADGTAALLVIFGGMLLVVYLLWKLIYWIVQCKIRRREAFYEDVKIYFKPIYFILSAIVGLIVFYVDYNNDIVNSLKFNPNFLVHFSEYPFLLKLLPLVLLLWVVSSVGMLWEMIKKYKTWWLIIYFPGTWSIGLVLIGLVFAAGWMIYFILPTVVTFAIMALVRDSSFVKVIESEGGSGKRIIGYNASNQPIREGEGGSVVYWGSRHPLDRND